MKHIVMSFLILFSALSFSWAGVTSPVNFMGSEACHQQMKVAEHDCCEESLTIKNCASCEGNCYCDTGYSQVNLGLLLSSATSNFTNLVSLISSFKVQLPADLTIAIDQPPKVFNT